MVDIRASLRVLVGGGQTDVVAGRPASTSFSADPGTIGQAQAQADGALIELQSVCPGELLDVVDPSQVSAAGATLAQLHEALARYPDAEGVMAAGDDPAWPRRLTNGDVRGPLAGRIDEWLAANGDRVPADLALALRGQLGVSPLIERPLQLVHNDYRSANVICQSGEVSAVLDFEEIGMDQAVVDLAWAAVMLGTRFRNWRPTPQKVMSTFLKGYCSVRPLSDVEAGWLPRLLLWQMLDGAASCGWDPAWMEAAAPAGRGRSRAITGRTSMEREEDNKYERKE